jgi:hypothetical protein
MFLLFREAVLQSNHAVEGVFVFGILTEVANAYELELLTLLGILEARLNTAILKLDQ